jgi:hypothetical protein
MSTLNTWFGWKFNTTPEELPAVFPLKITERDFINTDVENIYSMILTDVLERTHGIPDEVHDMLWDSCLKNASSEGLVTMLAKAMSERKQIFLVYERALRILRYATDEEAQRIREDYQTMGESQLGTFISFEKYVRTDMVRLYSAIEYYTVSSLNKQANLSSALQFKAKDLRGSTSAVDSSEVRSRAINVTKGLGQGKDVLIDAEDKIETATLQMEPVNKAIEFINQKRAFYLRLPSSYISGDLQAGGLSDTGEADQRAMERGLKSYFVSIIKPVLSSVFGISVQYKSQDFRMIGQALSALQTFSITDDDIVTQDQKRLIVQKLLDLEVEDSVDNI